MSFSQKGKFAAVPNTKEISDLTSRSKFLFTNTMLCLLKALEGKRVTVDIRNDSLLHGKLLTVDASMGLSMEKVIFKNAKGQATKLDQFYLQGRNVVYVHIPDEVNIIETMSWELRKTDHFKEKERQMRNKLFQQKSAKREAYLKNQMQRQKSSQRKDRGAKDH